MTTLLHLSVTFDQHKIHAYITQDLLPHQPWSLCLSSPSICAQASGHRSLHPRFTLRKLLPPTYGNAFPTVSY